MPSTPSIITTITRTLRTLGVARGSRICVAHSGGPDSTCLLHVLAGLQAGWHFTVLSVYLDHGLRNTPEIEDEIRFVRSFADKLGIECVIGRVPHGEIAREAAANRSSIEDVAREKRYAFLESTRDLLAARYIATGHTRDDSFETVVMRFFQGPGLSGVLDIPPRRGRIIRPLIACTKQEVLAYLDVSSIDYRTDSSNDERRFLRNRVRHMLIPVIREIFPGFERNLPEYGRRARSMRDFLHREAGSRLVWERIESGFRIAFEEFVHAHEYARLFSFLEMYDTLIPRSGQKRSGRLPYRFIALVRTLDPSGNDAQILRGHGIVLVKRDGFLWCSTDIVAHVKKGYLIAIGKRKSITIKISRETIESLTDDTTTGATKHSFRFDEREITHPVVIRSRRPGDSIVVRGTRKSVKKLFIDWKVPDDVRQSIPIIEDGSGIRAIAGAFFGFSDLFGDSRSRADKNSNDSIEVALYKQGKV